MLTSPRGTWPPSEEPGCSLGWGEQAKKQKLSDQEKGRNLERPREVIERAMGPLADPVGLFTNDNDNNHLQRANYFLDSALFTLCTLLLIYTTTLQVRTVYITILQVMPLSPVGNPKCREVIALPRPRSLRSGALSVKQVRDLGKDTPMVFMVPPYSEEVFAWWLLGKGLGMVEDEMH